MKKLILTLAAALCIFGVSYVAVADSQSKDGKVLCCHDGKCDTEHTLMECAKLGGKVVKDCKDCK